MIVWFTNRRLLPVRTFTSRAPLGWCLEQGLLSLDLHARIDEHAHRVGLPRVATAEACTGQQFRVERSSHVVIPCEPSRFASSAHNAAIRSRSSTLCCKSRILAKAGPSSGFTTRSTST